MRSLAVFISIGLHLLAVVIFLNIGVERERPQPPNVYQVALVAAPPGALSGGQAEGVGASRPKFVRTGQEISRELGHVDKSSASIAHSRQAVLPSGLPSPKTPDYGADYGDEPNSSVGKHGGGGGTPNASLVDSTAWQARVRAAMTRVWRFPPELERLDPNLMVTCSLTVNRSGALLAGKVLVTSGNAPFDRSVERALRTIRYLPAPPEGLMVGRSQLSFSMTFLPPEERR